MTAIAARIDAALQRAGWRPVGIRNEMSLSEDADLSYLRRTRTGHYQRSDDERLQLHVGVTVRSSSPVTGDLPYDPSVDVEGDVTAYRDAVRGALGTGQPRVVVHTAVRYFEDD